jgi:hypothetical protein
VEAISECDFRNIPISLDIFYGFTSITTHENTVEHTDRGPISQQLDPQARAVNISFFEFIIQQRTLDPYL